MHIKLGHGARRRVAVRCASEAPHFAVTLSPTSVGDDCFAGVFGASGDGVANPGLFDR